MLNLPKNGLPVKKILVCVSCVVKKSCQCFIFRAKSVMVNPLTKDTIEPEVASDYPTLDVRVPRSRFSSQFFWISASLRIRRAASLCSVFECEYHLCLNLRGNYGLAQGFELTDFE